MSNYELDYYNLGENMNTIKWYQSKTVWFNIVITIVGIVASLQGAKIFDNYADVFVVITLVGNVILRVWFTNSNISSTPSVQ